MIWNGELHQSVVCSGFLLVNLVCNIFLVSVCVRSSVLQSGVHLSVLSSPRVILVGTVYGQLPDCVKSLYRLREFLRVFQTWQLQLGLQDTIRDSPHTDHWILPMVPQSCLHPKRTAGGGCV